MVRPISIVWFERCYLGALVVGLLNTALSWNTTMAKMADNPQVAAYGPASVIVGTLLGIAMTLLLWYFAARKRANVAKWIITVFFVIGLLAIGFSVVMHTFPQGLAGVLGVVGFVLNLIAVWELFRPDAEAWFENKPMVDTATRR